MTFDRRTVLQTGLVSSATKGRTVARSFVLTLLQPTGQPGQRHSVGARPLTVGAGAENTIVLDDPQVSRKHAEFSMAGDGVRVRDLGSTNGTFWNGNRIHDVVVPSGSTLQFGNLKIRVAAADSPTVPPSEKTSFGSMVGQSLAMRELFAILELAAPSDATVLIEGESGTGKELAAKAIHDASPRANGPFVVLDCSAISEALLESHLFGHVRGAFTGAERDRKGAFVEASGGTLFLDELGELPLSAQAKLLRALEAQTVQPVGADRAITVDTRVVAATHRNLAGMVASQQFRFDLFYRLAVVHVALPSLRERPDDIALLVANFYQRKGISPGPIAGENLTRLCQHAWPGNVRELRNILERAIALSGSNNRFAELKLWLDSTSLGSPSDAQLQIDASMPFKEAKELWNDQFERRYVATVFASHKNNVTHAAEQAGLSRRHFRELLYKHGIVARPVSDEEE